MSKQSQKSSKIQSKARASDAKGIACAHLRWQVALHLLCLGQVDTHIIHQYSMATPGSVVNHEFVLIQMKTESNMSALFRLAR